MSEKKYIEDPEEIRLNENRELQQILGNPPGWLLHWGITFVFVGIVIFLTLGWLVKYPDVIPTPVVLTTPEPPIKVVAEGAGKLIRFDILDNQEIAAGDTLAILDNPTNLDDLGTLHDFLIEIRDGFSSADIKQMRFPRKLKLGGLQTAYADFSKNFDQHVLFLKNNNTYARIHNLENQIDGLKNIDRKLQERSVLLREEVNLTASKYERIKQLRALGDASKEEVEDARIESIGKERQMTSLENERYNNDLAIEQAEMRILEMKQQYGDGKASGVLSIQEDVEQMLNAIENWEKTFLIRAPIGGRIALNKFISTQQFIEQGEMLLTIVPDTTSEIIAKGVLPIRGSGKIKENMKANLRLSGFPYQEFGSIPCTVKRISLIPSEEGFVVELQVPSPLKTAYDKEIPFQQEMQGMANIVTEDRRILERVFDRILSIVLND